MNGLPKFVTGRLARPGGQSLVHPDADLLTAFLEQKVTRSEREQVFAHLSQCSACREVVTLAGPDTVTAPAAPAATGVRAWVRWPGMRWASVAAASVIVLAIGIALRSTLTEKGPSQPATEVVLKNEKSPAAPLADGKSTAEPSSTTRATESEKESAPVSHTKRSELARNEIASSKSKIAEPRGDRKIAPAPAPAAKLAFEKDAQAAYLDLKQRSAANETVEVTAQSASIPPASAAAPRATGIGVAGGSGVAGAMGGLAASTSRDQVGQNQGLDSHGNAQQRKFVIQPQQQAQAIVVQQASDGSKGNVAPPPGPPPPPTASSLPTTVVATNAQVPLEEKKEAVAGPLTLQTRPAGRTKAVLPKLRPNGFGETSYNPGTLKVSAGQSVSWKISPEGKLLRKSGDQNSWQSVELPSAARLHSLASNNLDVWVGGAPLGGESAGALFHTTDGGEHWQRIYGPWTGDILALQSSSANSSVTVRTAGGEWQSQDVGQNWIRTR